VIDPATPPSSSDRGELEGERVRGMQRFSMDLIQTICWSDSIRRGILSFDGTTAVTEDRAMIKGVERSTSSETDFIRRQEAERLERARGRRNQEPELEGLAAAAGVGDPAALERLHAVGVRAESVGALALAPLVEVAWADGAVAARERDEIRAAARAEGLSPAASVLLEVWLEAPPDPRLLSAWESYLTASAAATPAERRHELCDRLHARALGVARAAGGVLGVGRVSNRESLVLARVERVFYKLRMAASAAPT